MTSHPPCLRRGLCVVPVPIPGLTSDAMHSSATKMHRSSSIHAWLSSCASCRVLKPTWARGGMQATHAVLSANAQQQQQLFHRTRRWRRPSISLRRKARLLPVAQSQSGDAEETAQVVIIGSGVGGLCCGAVAAKHGLDVVVLVRVNGRG